MSKGYAAPETKAAAERARLLIEQAEALGEPAEDPLLSVFRPLRPLHSELYGVQRRRDAQLASAISRAGGEARNDRPGHDRAPPVWALSLLYIGEFAQGQLITIGRWRFLTLRHIVRWRRDLAKISGVTVLDFGHWLGGCLVIPEAALAETDSALKTPRAGRAKPPRFCLRFHVSFTHIFCGNYATANAQLDELADLGGGKAALSGRRWRNVLRVAFLPLPAGPRTQST